MWLESAKEYYVRLVERSNGVEEGIRGTRRTVRNCSVGGSTVLYFTVLYITAVE